MPPVVVRGTEVPGTFVKTEFEIVRVAWLTGDVVALALVPLTEEVLLVKPALELFTVMVALWPELSPTAQAVAPSPVPPIPPLLILGEPAET